VIALFTKNEFMLVSLESDREHLREGNAAGWDLRETHADIRAEFGDEGGRELEEEKRVCVVCNKNRQKEEVACVLSARRNEFNFERHN